MNTDSIGGFKVDSIPADPPPICFVARFHVPLAVHQRRQLYEYIRSRFAPTRWANVPILVMDPNVTLEVLRAPPDITQLVANQESQFQAPCTDQPPPASTPPA